MHSWLSRPPAYSTMQIVHTGHTLHVSLQVRRGLAWCTPLKSMSATDWTCTQPAYRPGCHPRCFTPWCLQVQMCAHFGFRMQSCLAAQLAPALPETAAPCLPCSWGGSLSPKGADLPHCCALEGSCRTLSGRLKRHPRSSGSCAPVVLVSLCGVPDVRQFQVEHLQSAGLHGLPAEVSVTAMKLTLHTVLRSA